MTAKAASRFQAESSPPHLTDSVQNNSTAERPHPTVRGGIEKTTRRLLGWRSLAAALVDAGLFHLRLVLSAAGLSLFSGVLVLFLLVVLLADLLHECLLLLRQLGASPGLRLLVFICGAGRQGQGATQTNREDQYTQHISNLSIVVSFVVLPLLTPDRTRRNTIWLHLVSQDASGTNAATRYGGIDVEARLNIGLKCVKTEKELKAAAAHVCGYPFLTAHSTALPFASPAVGYRGTSLVATAHRLSGHTLQLANLVPQQRSLLELQIVGGREHVGLEFAHGFGDIKIAARFIQHIRCLGRLVLPRRKAFLHRAADTAGGNVVFLVVGELSLTTML